MHSVNWDKLLNLVVRNAVKRSTQAKASIKKQNRNVKFLQLSTDFLLIVWDLKVGSEIENNAFSFDFVNLQSLKLLLNLSLISPHDADIEASGSHLVADFQANAVTPSSHDNPWVALIVPLINIVSTAQKVSFERAEHSERRWRNLNCANCSAHAECGKEISFAVHLHYKSLITQSFLFS